MTTHNQDFDTSELLNSSFYSSSSINALEHSRTFRNSLLLKEMSDNSINMSMNSTQDMRSHQENSSISNIKHNEADEPVVKTDESRKGEVQTVNMTTSPSLSALSEILNEKSKNADRQMRASRILDDSIIEEEEEEEDGIQEQEDGRPGISHGNIVTSSPNLIDLDDFPNHTGAEFINPNLDQSIEQPDFLTTPKVQQNVPRHTLPNYVIPETVNELEEVGTAETMVESNRDNATANINDKYVSDEAPKSKRLSVSLATAGKEVNKSLEKPTINESHLKKETKPAKNTYSEIMKGVSSKQNHSTSQIPMKKTRSNKHEQTKYLHEDKHTKSSKDSSKKKSIFSFLKRKSSRSVSETLSNTDKAAKDNKPNGMPVSATYSQLSSFKKNVEPSEANIDDSDSEPTEKITRKSHSSNSIFNTLRRKSGVPDTLAIPKNSNEIDVDVSITKQVSDVSNATEGTMLSIKSTQTKPDSTTVASSTISPIKPFIESPTQIPTVATATHNNMKRNPTPLNFESTLSNNLLSDLDETDKELCTVPTFEIPPVIGDSHKRDSGEAFFPKLLDADEIDSIVKIERNRSQRSSSLRRRSMDTLSIHAQNEGMTVTTASDVILSTPDLTKSPTSSILRSGRFDLIDNFQSADIHSDLDTNAFDNSYHENNQNLLASVEEKLDQLTNDYRNENIYDTRIQKELSQTQVPTKEDMNNDPDLMSDIMEFADLINFGDGIDLDMDINGNAEPESMEPTRSILAPTYMDVGDDEYEDDGINIISKEELGIVSDEDNYEDFLAKEQEGLGLELGTNANDHFHIEESDPDFEHEDFNDILENNDTIPERKRSILDSEFENSTDRPISMSFRGLTGPSLNASSEQDFGPMHEDEEGLLVAKQEDTEPETQSRVTFSGKIILYETYGEFEYDRHPDIGTCNQLTPQLAQMIKAELNELKSTMEVHESSKCYTQYF
ncbi:bud neck involved protein [Maudiozyma exigua]|uniref:Bud neck involved protein n=1 Tax=Maudiozyma exigua TaxID=34358 RepID=A0A9P7BBU9_MAUEX|nr:bud neck involved protein [Kazachstania exigua]